MPNKKKTQELSKRAKIKKILIIVGLVGFILLVISGFIKVERGLASDKSYNNALPMISKTMPTEEPTPEIVDEKISPETTPHGQHIIVKISHYNPNLGGVNCATWEDGGCAAKMSDGEAWQDYFNDETIACPFELPFGTVVWVDGTNYVCRDRGGAIVITSEGYYWIDILAEHVPYTYGELRDAVIVANP